VWQVQADAIRLANDSEYGLVAAVFTRDTARRLRVARQIRSRICHINGPGGVGASGYGRRLAHSNCPDSLLKV
jgi:benzaldehyde dehydrogenase (NAD)